ncbi:MAG: TadE/TadG family type IV pilus assembly protein [Rhizomicrobium sp.]
MERVRARARRFLRNNDANVAMIFAISIIPVTIAAGTGLDLARAMIVKSSLSEALDASALAVASTTGLTQAQMQTEAQNYFNANYKADSSYGTPAAVAVVQSGQQVTVSTTVPMPTTLINVAGIHTVNVASSSTVVWGQNKLWVSLVLDNTGSMTQTDSTGTSKISALQTATHQLLTMLQNASSTAGDVRAAIIPFSKTVNVGTANAGATWIDWTDWEAAPAGSTPSGTVGPGSSCPYSWSSNGFYCAPSATNDANCFNGRGDDCADTIPSSGLICPSAPSANASTGLGGHYYNGCWNSVRSQTKTTTTNVTTVTTTKQSCTSNTSGGNVSCSNKSGYPSTASPTTTSSSATTNGYTGDSTTTSSNTTSGTVDGSKSCTSKTCSWTRTITSTKVDQTVAKTGTGNYNHTWVVNDHSTWHGCIMDRTQNYDTTFTTPTTTATKFPAENSQSCVPSVLGTLSYDWTSLNAQVTAMTAGGSTNQTIGLAWGMQALTIGDPLNAPSLPANTKQYIIILSDGLNTQNRWDGDGSNQETDVDDRMAIACTNAKTAGFTIYAVFVDLNGTQGNSSVLQNCASDSSKYFDLTTSGAIITTLNAIGQQITNLRVAQ